MKRFISCVVSAVVVGSVLTGCSIPGINQENGDDELLSEYYSDSSEVSQPAENQYSWILSPSVSAENIISFDGSQVDPESELNRAYANYSVIQREGKFGLIDYRGNIVVQPEYDYYYTCWCGEISFYNITDIKNDIREYCSVDATKQVVKYTADHYSNAPKYYWCDGQVYVKNSGDDYASLYTGKKTVAVQEAQVSENWDGKYEINTTEDSLFGLAKNNELLLDIQYTDCYAPAYKGAGLTCIAFKNSEGKWGYVNSEGEIVIDFICDGDASSYGGELIDNPTETHPYLFTGDYVPVLVNASFGYYDIEGNRVVIPGEFEQARPVHNGRAWVRKDGLWGVIQLGEIVEEEIEEESSQEETTTTTTTQWTTTTTTEETTTTQAYTEPPVETYPQESETEYTEQSSEWENTEPEIPEEPVVTDPPDQPAYTETEQVWQPDEQNWQ